MTSRAVQIGVFIASLGALAASLWFTRDAGNGAPPANPSSHTGAVPRDAAAATAHPAPFEAFAGARVGDWYAYHVDSVGSLGETHATAMVWVTAADDHVVTRAMRGRVDATGVEKQEPDEHFPRAGLTIERLDGDDIGQWTLSDVVAIADTHEVGGKAFACTKVSFASRDPLFERKRTRTVLWLSSEVPAGGVIARREEQHLDAMTFVLTQELTGYGTAGGVTWGVRPDGW
jgi:hypothetical protein